MPVVKSSVDCPVYDSFRVQQVAGLFDVPLAERASVTFAVEVPGADEDWQIGLIVGPSGSGKSTIARAAFGESLYAMPPWPAEQAVVDGFGRLPLREIVGLLTAVGFSSPPAWVKPYRVLSGGERFRCDLARALAAAIERAGEAADAPAPIVAFDEFTSVVDRQVAQFGSAAIAKALRGEVSRARFVAISCHYDVAEWLEPDWVVDMATQRLERRRLRRPTIELEIWTISRSIWASIFICSAVDSRHPSFDLTRNLFPRDTHDCSARHRPLSGNHTIGPLFAGHGARHLPLDYDAEYRATRKLSGRGRNADHRI